MTPTRRRVLQWGGGAVAALFAPRLAARSADVIEIRMAGRADGSHVWFDPIGVHVLPGQTIRWINRDPANAHTATAYHPANYDRPRRIPAAARPWDSSYLLPDESYSITLTESGVYDYYCIPHERAGMVGRIIVGAPGSGRRKTGEGAGQGLPEVALRSFPPVAEILENGIVRRGQMPIDPEASR